MSPNLTMDEEGHAKILGAYMDKLNDKEIGILLRRALANSDVPSKVNLLTKLLSHRKQPDQRMLVQIGEHFEPAMDIDTIRNQLADLLPADGASGIKREPGNDTDEQEMDTVAPESEAKQAGRVPSKSKARKNAAEDTAKTTTKAANAKPSKPKANTSTKVDGSTTAAAKQRAKTATPAAKRSAKTPTPAPKASARKRASSAVDEREIDAPAKKQRPKKNNVQSEIALLRERNKWIKEARKLGMNEEADDALRKVLGGMSE